MTKIEEILKEIREKIETREKQIDGVYEAIIDVSSNTNATLQSIRAFVDDLREDLQNIETKLNTIEKTIHDKLEKKSLLGWLFG